VYWQEVEFGLFFIEKEEGRRKKEEGRRKREEGRGKKEETIIS
jgi:hypothetical protein